MSRICRDYWVLSLVLVGFYVPLCLWISRLSAQSSGGLGLGNIGAPLLAALVIAIGGATLATLFGSAAALLLDVYPVRWRRLLTAILLMPFLLPAVVVTNGLNSLLAGGPLTFLIRGLVGATVISAVQMAPLILWGVSRSLASVPGPERDAGLLAATPRRRLHLLGIRIAPDALRYGLLAVVLLFPRLEVPLYTGVETVGVRILSAFTSQENDAHGLLLVGITVAILAPLFALAGRVFSGPGHGSLPPESIHTSPGRVPNLLACTVGAAMLLPLLTLARLAVRPVPAAELLYMNQGLAIEVARALLVALPLAWMGWRLAERSNAFAAMLFSLPMLLPGTIPGLALSLGVQPHLPYALVDLPLLLSLGQACRFAGVAYVFGVIARESVPRSERDALRLALPPARWSRALFGRVAPVLASAALVLTVLILGEVETAALLVPPGYVSPAVEVHQFLHFRFDEQAAQYSLALALVCTLLALTLSRLGKGLR